MSPLPYRVRAGLTRLTRAIASPPSADRVAAYWAQLASDTIVEDLGRVSWSGVPQVHLNHNFLITGSRDAYWVDWLRDRHLGGGDVGDVLSLGCGAGHLDRIFKRSGYRFRSFTGLDISGAAVGRAREMAAEVQLAPRISYDVADLNRHELPAAGFDFIYFFQSLHHIEALEFALDQCRRALRPGGTLLVNEFVGPSRFQWTERQLDEANAVFVTLPEELRRNLTHGGVKQRIERPSVAHMVRNDPSESVRAAEIEPLLHDRFDVFQSWNWGGTLNHLVFQDIAGNFDTAQPAHAAIVELLIHHENTLIAGGLLPSDFKVFLARHR